MTKYTKDSPQPQAATPRPPRRSVSAPPNHQLEILRCVARYLAQKWAPVPLPLGSKAPKMAGWPSFRTSETSAARDFARAGGVGLILGRASNGLVDVDLDCAEAVALARDLLPPTAMISGRPGNPSSHMWYQVDGPLPTEQYLDPAPPAGVSAMLVEARGEGAQTAAPPTIHPVDGDQYGWESEGPPACVTADDLLHAVRRVAAGSLLVRAWREGTRHDLALALAGTLACSGWEPAEVVAYVRAIAAAAADPEIDDRLRAVDSTLERHGAGEPITAGRHLGKLLDAHVAEKIVRWLNLSCGDRDVELPTDDEAPRSRYLVAGGALCVPGKNGVTPLCNFDAWIEKEVTYIDGATTEVDYIIAGVCRDGSPLPAIRVAAAEYAKMHWVGGSWGARAIIAAGLNYKDKLREAIQCRRIPTRETVYRQIGWVTIGGTDAYLHTGGAIGADGVTVELPPPLDRYGLPSSVEDLVGAVQCSARLLECAPSEVSIPLLALVYLAPLATIVIIDHVVWIVGPSGSLKSVLAELALAHFGSMGRTTMPANWSSTAAAIEHTMFTLADSLTVIDDYAPQGSTQLQRQLEALAMRIVRGVGNRSARGRMNRDLTRHADYPPRCATLSTGEQLPPGLSIHGRMVVVEVDRGALSLSEITKMQEQRDRLPHAMAGYIAWLQPQLARLRTELPARQRDLRASFEGSGGHMRERDALALLMIGMELFARFAVEVGAVDAATAARWREDAERALRAIGSRETNHVKDADPAELFLATLRSARAGGIVMLDPIDHDQAVENLDSGLRIGWRDASHVFLDPVLARKTVVEIHQRSGDPWPYTVRAVHEALVRRGYVSVGSDGRPTTQKRIWGRKERVLMIAARHFDGDDELS